MTNNMKLQMQPRLRFLCKEHPTLGCSSTVEHITADGQTTLCGSKDSGEPRDDVDWDALHGPRFHRQCPRCRAAAVLLLRPKASFHYLDPFHGNVKEFGSLKEARNSAKTEHGTCYIEQVGPGDVHKTVDVVSGLDPLP